MFKESDAPMLGWEVYAHKDKWGDSTGISLLADASKQLAAGEDMTHATAETSRTPLHYAMEEFLGCIWEKKKPGCGATEGYQAAVVALKANEAVNTGGKVTFQKDWFQL
jgi:hypothetical protein